MKKPNSSIGKSRWILVAFILIAVVGLFLYLLLHESDDESVLRLYGNVDIREVELAFRQPGRLIGMKFEEGDFVTAGEVMAQLDARPYEDRLAAAQAELQMSKSEMDKLRSGNRPQEITQAQEAVNRAEAAFWDAERNYKRQESLLESGASSQRTVDAAKVARDSATANLTSSRAALSLVMDGFRSEDISAGEARVAVAEAALAQAITALDDAELVAPSDAVVLVRVREPGSMVSSSTPVYNLSLRDPVYVRAYVSESNLGLIAPGTQVRVYTDSSDQVYRGQVGFISPRAEFTPKTVETTDLRTDLVYRLRVVILGDGQGLLQGMPVTVDVDTMPTRIEAVDLQ